MEGMEERCPGVGKQYFIPIYWSIHRNEGIGMKRHLPIAEHPFSLPSIASVVSFPKQHLQAVSRRYAFSETWMRVLPHVWLLTSAAKNSVLGGAK